MTLIEQLEEIERALGVTDSVFAARLGMSAGVWRQIATSRRLVGRALLGRILLAYPELEGDVLDYIRQTETELQSQQIAVGG